MVRINKINKTIIQTSKKFTNETKIILVRPDEKFLIDPRDVRQIVTELYNKVKKQTNDFHAYLRVWNIDRVYSFNIDEDGNIHNYDNHEEYFRNSIRRNAMNKFLKHGKVEITVERYK